MTMPTHRRAFRMIFASCLALTAGCSFFMPADTLRPQAAFDLQCPSDKLTITELGGDCGKKVANDYDCTLGVSGCGKQSTYSHIPRSNIWAANNNAERKTTP